MPNIIEPTDSRLTWQGAISLHKTDAWTMPWRIPHERINLFPPEALQERAAMPAGVRISFHSDTTTTAGEFLPHPELTQLDVYCDGKFHASLQLEGADCFRADGLPAGEKLVELWLPQYGEFRLKSLELSEGATLAPYEDARPKWVTYGSSITHCRTSESSSNTWPAIVARTRGLNLTCLGYGGNCHLEPMLARMIRDLPADYLSMKVGINIQGSGSLNARTFRSAIIGFVQIVREGHPNTPFAVCSPIFSPPREDTPNNVGFSLKDMREEVREAVEALKSYGDSNIYYVDGLKLFGPDLAHLLPDELHPNPEGYKFLARNFLREVAEPIFN